MVASNEVDPDTSTQAERPRASFERALQGAALTAATSFAGASGALAEYVDPDDVSELCTHPSCVANDWVIEVSSNAFLR